MLQYLNLPNGISLVYGPPASGKTTLCMQLVASNPGKVIFIDTENTFNVERVQQMNPLIDLDNVMVISAGRYSQQFSAVKNLCKMKNVSLVIIDSFTKYYRKKLHEKVVINPPTIKMLNMLKELGVPVVLTSQVYTNFEGEDKPIAGELIGRFSNYIVRLDNEPRKLLIEQTGVEVPFIITEKGMDNFL